MQRHAFVCAGAVALATLAAACKGPERPRMPSAVAQTVAIGRDGALLRGVAGDGTLTYAALASADRTSRLCRGAQHSQGECGVDPSATPTSTIEARRGDAIAWQVTVGGTAGDIVVAGSLLAIAIAGTGSLDLAGPLALRGDPAAVLVALDRATGSHRFRLAFDSTEWALITSMAAAGEDVIVAGAFGGTLRVGARVVSSAGGSDAFVARVLPSGKLGWLVRFGGTGADAVQGVATRGPRIAIAGTFTAGADLLGAPLAAADERAPFGDAYVAELDGNGQRRWHATFGGRADDAVAGVAFDGSGRVVVAATVRDVVRVGSSMHVVQGPSDGLLVWFGEDGELGTSTLVGGPDFDGIRGIASLGDHVVVIAGFFSGTLRLGERQLTAGGGDDSFVAAVDASGTVVASWHVGGAGREEITSIASIAGGFIAGIAHTAAASVDDVRLAAPDNAARGAAVIVRGL